ncbi:site-specific DNA-methyltransferase [Halobacteriovorax sp. YZS-1-1]|uniref:site-specific DNA-methyltransferase n=1 Tax=unclassified Halobacteriovorax TaxID=2639665 RepID=UPI00399B5F27
MSVEKFKEKYNITDEKIYMLSKIFPDAFVDGKIDWTLMRQSLGKFMVDGDDLNDFYGLLWPGKVKSQKLSFVPSSKCLNFIDTIGNNPENVFCIGDNLEVLKVIKNAYVQQVKMIYIDPPYNTGKDFVYVDNYQQTETEYLKDINASDDSGSKLQANPKTTGRFHSNWLSMMYPRLKIARELLKDDGIIFISIDENEVMNLTLMMNEIFGEENFISHLIWQNKKGGGNDARHLAVEHEYILMYAKEKESVGHLFEEYSEKYLERYKEEDSVGKFYWDTFKRKSGKQYYSITCPDGTIMDKDENGNPISWLRSEKRFKSDLEIGDVKIEKKGDKWGVYFKQRLPAGKKPRSILNQVGTTSDGNKENLEMFGSNIFDNPKPISLIEYLIDIGTSDKDDIVLDFFAGSGTTGVACLNKNRRFVIVQLPEYLDSNNKRQVSALKFCNENNIEANLAELTKERIKRVIANLEKNLQEVRGVSVFKEEISEISEVMRKTKTQQDFFLEEINYENKEKLLWDIISKEGFPLSSNVNLLELGKNKVFEVTTDFSTMKLFICLDEAIKVESVEEVLKEDSHYLVCLDSSISDNEKVILADLGRIITI